MMAAAAIAMLAAEPCADVAPSILAEGFVSSAYAHEGVDWISSDASHVLFTRAAPDFSKAWLFSAARDEIGWRVTQLEISTGPYDAGLAISPDGREALFTSTRGGEGVSEGNWTIWRANAAFENGEWRIDSAEPLSSPVNSEHSECCAIYGEHGEIFFSSDRKGDWSIYRAVPGQGGYKVALLNGPLDTEAGEWPSAYSPEEGVLLLSSIRQSGRGGDDVYIARRQGESWSAAIELNGAVNSPEYEDSARLFHGRLYWSSRRSADGSKSSVSNIFYLPRTCVQAVEPTEE